MTATVRRTIRTLDADMVEDAADQAVVCLWDEEHPMHTGAPQLPFLSAPMDKHTWVSLT